MASKVELRGTIARLDETALVDGLNHAELTTLLASLKADAEEGERLDAEVDAAKDTVAQDVATMDKEPDAPAPAPAAEDRSDKAAYAVAGGKALTTKRGIMDEGSIIAATDLAGGQEAIDAFLKSGHVVKA